MANASDQFRQSDVTFWGAVALLSAGIAVFGANVSALIPQTIIGGLHAPRIANTSVETLRRQLSDLRSETARLSLENKTLLTRFSLQEKSGNEVVRRVGALEVTVPRILETVPVDQLIDRSTMTSAIGEVFELPAEGGTVLVRQTVLPGVGPINSTSDQPLPPPLSPAPQRTSPNPIPFGVAIGGFVTEDAAQLEWEDLELKIGPLLLGLSPVLQTAGAQGSRIVLGPMETLAEAREMCERLERIAFSCLPASYEGRQMIAQQTL